MSQTQTQQTNPPFVISTSQWAGMNLATSRSQIDDQEVWWTENLWPVAPGILRAGWGPNPAPVYNAPPGVKIRRIFFGNVNGEYEVGFIYKSDSTVDQVRLDTKEVIELGHLWQDNPSALAAFKIWRPAEFGYGQGGPGIALIGSPLGLFAWDGTTIYTPGAGAPPMLTGDFTGSTSTPMPSDLPGILAMEVYKERLWVVGATVVSFSAPGNGANFSTAAGGGEFAYYGDQLTGSYTDIAASAGYLWLFGDSSVQTIYNVLLNGAGTVTDPFTTTFLNSNVDPQVGHAFYRKVGIWSRAFTLWQSPGLFRLYGGSGRLISNKLAPMFDQGRVPSIDTSVITPSMAPLDLFGMRWMLFNAMFVDPWGQKRTLMLVFTDQTQEAAAVQAPIWTVATQGIELTEIGGYESGGHCSVYGTDGSSLYQLFDGPDPALVKRLSTKAYTGANVLTNKDFRNVYLKVRDNEMFGVSIRGTMTAQDGDAVGGEAELSFDVPPGGDQVCLCRADGKGMQAAVDLVSQSADFSIARLSLTFTERNIWGH